MDADNSHIELRILDWILKSQTLDGLEQFEEAIRRYDKALTIKLVKYGFLCKSRSLALLERYLESNGAYEKGVKNNRDDDGLLKML